MCGTSRNEVLQNLMIASKKKKKKKKKKKEDHELNVRIQQYPNSTDTEVWTFKRFPFPGLQALYNLSPLQEIRGALWLL